MISDDKLKDILLRENYVSAENIAKAEEKAKERGSSFVDWLFEEAIISQDTLGQAVAEAYDIKYADLGSNPPVKELLLKLPEAVAKKFKAVPFKEDATKVIVATDDPKQTGIVTEMEKFFAGKKVEIYYANTQDINDQFINFRRTLKTRFSEIIEKSEKFAPEVLSEIFNDAINFHASDVHFEPQETETIIRFRVDGALQEAGKIPKEYYENILNRIKVESHLRIDEHTAAQDGSMRYTNPEGYVDMRVSVVPILDGEKVSIRLLSQYVRSFTMSDLGLAHDDEERLEKFSKKPFGMILVTGPTGSGKTTSLYAVLKMLNTPDKNITTIEDPAEYRITGVNQIQVNSQTNLTFAKGLRSIVRQDPDIILVGEIRDNETAEIAVNAALTGHLLLSTFHANDAATAVPRLLDMEIEPFLLSSTLEIIIAQRLVRKLCEKCRKSLSLSTAQIKEKYPEAAKYLPEKASLYVAPGCEACNHSGFKGRTAIFEMIEMTKEIKAKIMEHPSSEEIRQIATKAGNRTMFEDGLDKVLAGVTTLDELIRVANPPE
ncbi:MAG: ATPase, T2SS/T4P/T4SS family [Candidatus Berkelbacteria bacterium]